MILANRFLYWVDKLYGFLIKIGSYLQSLFLLYMRLTWGHQFFLIGMEKLKDIPGTTRFFAELGLSHSALYAHMVGFLEAAGGIFLIIGFASRLISLPLLIILITALSTAHAENLSNFRFLFDPHSLVGENPYPFLITTLMVLAFGPGRISLDGWLKRWVSHQPRY